VIEITTSLSIFCWVEQQDIEEVEDLDIIMTLKSF